MTTTSGSTVTIHNPDPARHEDYDRPEIHVYTIGR